MKTKPNSTRAEDTYYKIVRVRGTRLEALMATYTYEIGRWHRVGGPLTYCMRGFHVALSNSIRYWWENYATPADRRLGFPVGKYRIYETQIGHVRLPPRLDGGAINSEKVCTSRIKLIRRVKIADLRQRGHWVR